MDPTTTTPTSGRYGCGTESEELRSASIGSIHSKKWGDYIWCHGKYIYISLEEMNAVAEFIKRVGRISISHLAGKSNQFIDLKPKTQVVEDRVSLEEIAAA
ncbi:hypothetical protein KY285_031609 [Solanum tuberosum]|nr:hypothetical protein KY284_031402 [Solanum tuberosum]KAH0654140.1 hypothetical protein KY289_031818 [Solanum tuberosum]KAH0656727.1 hypothetical protein KY285_031609 [Solanum tuberosum]